MIRLRRLLALAFLALAFGLGQQAAELHELAHAIQATQDSGPGKLPPPDSCPKCFAFAHLFGAVPTWSAHAAAGSEGDSPDAFVFLPAQSRTVVSSRSRAPPPLS